MFLQAPAGPYQPGAATPQVSALLMQIQLCLICEALVSVPSETGVPAEFDFACPGRHMMLQSMAGQLLLSMRGLMDLERL